MENFIKVPSENKLLLDKETGEITTYFHTKKVTIDEFIMIFFSSYSVLLKLSGFTLKVLMCCWKHSSFSPNIEKEGNIIHNDTMFKEYCFSQGFTNSAASIDNAISELARKGILIKKCRGSYLMNPEYFFKGKLSDRSKLQYNIIVEPTKE